MQELIHTMHRERERERDYRPVRSKQAAYRGLRSVHGRREFAELVADQVLLKPTNITTLL